VSDPIPTTTRLVDPYDILYHVVLEELRFLTRLAVDLQGQQIQEAVAAMASVIAACNLIPAVEGDTTHKRCLQGLAGLAAIREWASLHTTGAPGEPVPLRPRPTVTAEWIF
jgi:hypothetical protein